MKIIVSSANLLKHLSSVGGVVTSSTIMPILDNFLFEINDNTIKITASDLQTYLVTSLDVDVIEGSKLKIAVPASIILDTLKNLPNQQIELNINTESYSVEIKSNNGKYRIVCENAEDYPECPEYVADITMGISVLVLKRVINKMLFAVSTDETKPFLTGVFVEIGPELEKTELNNDTTTYEEDTDLVPSSISNTNKSQAIFAASNGNKLSKYVLKDLNIKNFSPSYISTSTSNGELNENEFKTSSLSKTRYMSCIIPKKPLSIVNNFSTKEDDIVEVSLNKSHAYIKVGNIETTTRLIEETYPNYKNVLPSESPYKITVDRIDILSSLKRVSIYANKTNNFIKFSISENKLKILTRDNSFCNKAFETIPCHYEGENFEIGFNSKFLIETLSKIDTDEAVLHIGGPHRAVLLFPSNQLENEDVLLLVMPVAIEVEKVAEDKVL